MLRKGRFVLGFLLLAVSAVAQQRLPDPLAHPVNARIGDASTTPYTPDSESPAVSGASTREGTTHVRPFPLLGAQSAALPRPSFEVSVGDLVVRSRTDPRF